MSRFAKVFFDGASRGNGGHSGCGYTIKGLLDHESLDLSGYLYIGKRTSNESEYSALILGLYVLRSSLIDSKTNPDTVKISVFGDSKLVINQVTGAYATRAPNLISYNKTARELAGCFKNIEFIHIRREYNREADALSNDAIDEYLANITVSGSARQRN